jgi:hypothetical protein
MKRKQSAGKCLGPRPAGTGRSRKAMPPQGYHWSLEPDLPDCALLHPMVCGLFGFVVSSAAEADLSRRKT